MSKKLTIAIDGPSGAGKSTVSRALAIRLGYIYIDTGAMYRAVALKARERGLDMGDEPSLSRLARSLRISFVNEGGITRVLCDGEDITEAIRSPEISRLASDISAKKAVREALVEKQREMGRGGGVVLEGRDVGTVVFPDADIKFYLDAEAAERARRRHSELSEKGVAVDFTETLREVTQRDHHDMNRAHSPLRKAEDAIFIDSTSRSMDEVVETMIRFVIEKGKGV